MKTIQLFTWLYFLWSIVAAHAQESIGGRPYGVENPSVGASLATKTAPQVDILALRAANQTAKQNGTPLPCGKILSADWSLQNAGTWTTLPNQDRLWELRIHAPGALGTSLYFNQFYLPPGARLYVYSEDKSHVIGAFTEQNNQPEKLFATEIVYSATCIVEYYEPVAVQGKGSFTITGVSHVFYVPPFVTRRSVGQNDDSGSCNVNVNCPEGSNWQAQKRAVARILLRVGSSQFLCSGALLNNTRQDNKPFFLTAEHCGGADASASDFNQWVFYFNYEASGCSNPSSDPVSKTITGCVQRARGEASDFQLLEFNNPVPANYNVYYAGWDATGNASPSGVCIHHPAGDIKKISTYNTPLTNDGSDHWKANWARTATNWGVTEGGSSGSPLFSSTGLVVGDETGGPSECGISADKAYDVYGKVSYSWVSNGTAANQRLKPWLDAANSGVLTLSGKDGGSVSCNATVPAGLVVNNITSTTATAQWNAVPATTYEVRYKKAADGSWTTLSASSTSLTLSGLAVSTAYEVQVRSKCPNGTTSAFTGSVNFTTGNSGGCTATLPTALAVNNVTASGASFTWRAASGATYDFRYRKLDAVSRWVVVPASTNAFTLTNLLGSTTYEAQVRSKCPNGSVSAYSKAVSFTTGSSNCTNVTLTLTLDDYPEETSWLIQNSAGATVASGGPYSNSPDGSTIKATKCLPAGCYTFIINDAAGDGICCEYGNGSYTLKDDAGTTLASGGSFGESATEDFCLGGAQARTERAGAEVLPAVQLYPNPTNGYLHVTVPGAEVTWMRIESVNGLEMNRTPGNTMGIDASRLPAGIYILTIQTTQGMIRKKFIKE